jgi:hypothetical protein
LPLLLLYEGNKSPGDPEKLRRNTRREEEEEEDEEEEEKELVENILKQERKDLREFQEIFLNVLHVYGSLKIGV